MCVDDEEFVLAFYLHALTQRGYDVVQCMRGDQALAMLKKKAVDLVLLDIEMPGMSGLEVLDILRKDERLNALSIVIVSSDDSERTVEEGLAMGADDYLVKPVTAGELLAKVGTALKKHKLASLKSYGLGFGSLLNGRYEITSKLGDGGFSTVYVARDHSLDPPHEVALKMFSPELMTDQRFKTRFLREAYAHCRLKHAHIVDLLDFGQSESAYYLVMEYLDGMTLEEIIGANGPMDEGTVTLMALDILKALQHLANHQLIHRDIKPHNILITRDGSAKLLDFGLCRNIREETLSSRDDMCGTPFFISPEYIRGSEDLDIRADVYSLGITLYYALTLRPPYPDDAPMAMLDHHLNTEPMKLDRYRDDISPPFCALIDSMLAKRREDRPYPEALLKQLRALMDEAEAEAE